MKYRSIILYLYRLVPNSYPQKSPLDNCLDYQQVERKVSHISNAMPVITNAHFFVFLRITSEFRLCVFLMEFVLNQEESIGLLGDLTLTLASQTTFDRTYSVRKLEITGTDEVPDLFTGANIFGMPLKLTLMCLPCIQAIQDIFPMFEFEDERFL